MRRELCARSLFLSCSLDPLLMASEADAGALLLNDTFATGDLPEVEALERATTLEPSIRRPPCLQRNPLRFVTYVTSKDAATADCTRHRRQPRFILTGPMRLGLTGALSERENAMDREQRHLELEALKSTRSLPAR